MNGERILGTELTKEEFEEEYHNQLDEKGNVEIIDLETNEVTEISEEEFKEMISDEIKKK